MSKRIIIAVVVLGMAFAPSALPHSGSVTGFMVNVAMAAETDGSGVNLSVENPGLLPTNPFYFLKSIKRTTQRALTMTTVKKIDLELDILNQKAAEIQRLWEIMPDDSDAILNALDFYQVNVNNLVSLTSKLSGFEKDANYERLASKILGYVVKHIEVLDELKAGGEIRLKDKIYSLQNGLGIIVSVVVKMDGFDKFEERLLSVLEGGDVVRELRAVETLNYFQDALSADSLEKQYVARIKENLVLRAEALAVAQDEIAASLPAVLGGSVSDAWHRIKMLDETREYVKNAAFKNNLSLIRQLIFDVALRSKSFGKSEAEKTINEGQAILDALNKKNEVFKSQFIGSLLSRAEFNLKQAKESMTAGQYAQAVGQSSMAMATLENALSQSVIIFNAGAEKEIKKMKQGYDEMARLAKENKLTKENSPALYVLFNQLEKSLAKLSDKSKKPETIITLMRDTKLLFYGTEYMLDRAIDNLKTE